MRVDPDRRQIVRRRRTSTCDGASDRRHALHDRVDQVGQVVQLERRMERAALDPAQVEHVPDQPAEPLAPRGRSICAIARPASGVERDVGVHQVPGRRPDRGERRSEVVRDRVEQRGLERVALARHLDGRGLGREPVADHRLPELVGGGGQQPRVRAAREGVAARARGPQRADRLAAERRSGRGGPSAARRRGGPRPRSRASPASRPSRRRHRRLADLDPARLAVGRAGMERPARRHRRPRLARRRCRRRPAPRRSTAPRPIQTRAISASRTRREASSGAASRARGGRGDVAAHGEHRPGLGAAQLGLAAPLQLERAQPADRDGHDEEEQQVEPLLRRGDGEGVERLDEEEVVEQERRDGRRRRPASCRSPCPRRRPPAGRRSRRPERPTARGARAARPVARARLATATRRPADRGRWGRGESQARSLSTRSW